MERAEACILRSAAHPIVRQEKMIKWVNPDQVDRRPDRCLDLPRQGSGGWSRRR